MLNRQLWWLIPVGYTEEAEAGGSDFEGRLGSTVGLMRWITQWVMCSQSKADILSSIPRTRVKVEGKSHLHKELYSDLHTTAFKPTHNANNTA